MLLVRRGTDDGGRSTANINLCVLQSITWLEYVTGATSKEDGYFEEEKARSGEESAWQRSSTGMAKSRENAERRRKAVVSDRKEESVQIDRGS